MRIAGLVLAGGRSSRMAGVDKAHATLAGRSLLARAVERLRPQVDALAVSSNAEHQDVTSLNCPVLADPLPDYPGPLAGVLAGLEWANRDFDAVASVAVDTPFFPTDFVARLSEGGAETVAAARSEGRLHPVFALWPMGMAQPLRQFLESGRTRRVTDFLDQVGFRAISFRVTPLPSGALDPFFNINTPGDLARAEDFVREIAS